MKSQFIQDNKTIVPVPLKTKSTPSFPPGWYRPFEKMLGLMSSTTALEILDAPILPSSAEYIARHYINFNIIDKYFSEQSQIFHQKIGAIRKLGIMLYGPHGTAKTTTMHFIADMMIKKYNARVFNIRNTAGFKAVISLINVARDNGDNFISVFVFDECEDAMTQNISFYKRMLDGEADYKDSLFLFSTNHIEDVSTSIKDRPSRIKMLVEMPNFKSDEEDLIFHVLNAMNNDLISDELALTREELNSLTRNCVDNSMDNIKNIFLDAVFDKNIGIERKKLSSIT